MVLPPPIRIDGKEVVGSKLIVSMCNLPMKKPFFFFFFFNP